MTPLPALALVALLAGAPIAALAQAEPTGPTSDPTQVKPGRYRLDPAHGKITWSLSHLGYSTYYGQITGVAGEATLDPRDPAKSRLSVTIDTASVNGLNDKLNEHLKAPDFFDVPKFPQATYVSTSVEPTSPTTARVNGELTIKGITRVVSFDATFNQAGVNPVDKAYSVGFDGRAVIRRSDFGVNAFLPILGDEVQLRLEGEFKAVP
ncbi:MULTISPECIES: YceI family protein [Methylobacterium]|uniref:Protein YceI n=1 Tax=Methylobacterium thuringiense TaxID=1003091 RepID=A0ABQ4THC9_9HYPH|nr:MULTISPECIES: YceI family protein [Methylobacterium]TXN24476.1 YceI family protein [Methylobacterium sp. WL9]GJE54401.1 Protein YceI [Methylobacterium thuringiense]